MLNTLAMTTKLFFMRKTPPKKAMECPSKTHLPQGITSKNKPHTRVCLYWDSDLPLFLQARVQAVDRGEAGQECKKIPSSSILQPRHRGHPRPARDQLPGCLQRGRPQAHGAASGGAHRPICCLQRTPCCCPPAGCRLAQHLQPPADRPTWEDRVQWNDQSRGEQRQQCCSKTHAFTIGSTSI